jgi:hypothetical protein
LVKIEGPGAGIPFIIIYLLLKGFVQTLSINQPTNGNLGHLSKSGAKNDLFCCGISSSPPNKNGISAQTQIDNPPH